MLRVAIQKAKKKKNKLAEECVSFGLSEKSKQESEKSIEASAQGPTDAESEQTSDTEHGSFEEEGGKTIDAQRETREDLKGESKSDQPANIAAMGAITLDSLSPESWLRLYPQLEISGIAANVLANSDFQRADSSSIHFVLDHSQSAVFSEELLPKISRSLSGYFAFEVSVQIKIGDAKNETPAMLSQRLKKEKHIAMVNEFESDENVRELLKRFSGTLAIETIASHKD